MAGPQQLLATISERLHSSATVRSVYGDPVVVENRTVVPIASVMYGFGGGGGAGPRRGATEGKAMDLGEGMGGGAGVVIKPQGYIEITASGSRYVPLHDNRKLVGAVAAGFLLGWLLKRSA